MATLQPMQLIEPHASDHLSSVWCVWACAAWLIALMNPVSLLTLRCVRSLTVSTLPLLLALLGQAHRGGVMWWNIFSNRDGWRPWLAVLEDSARALFGARLSCLDTPYASSNEVSLAQTYHNSTTVAPLFVLRVSDSSALSVRGTAYCTQFAHTQQTTH